MCGTEEDIDSAQNNAHATKIKATTNQITEHD